MRDLNRLKPDAVPVRESGAVDPRRTLAVLVLGGLTFAMSQTMMNPALTQLMRRFQVSEADVAWTVSAFFITAAIAPIVAGRLGDMFGKKRVLITQLLIFTMGALVSAAGPTVWAVVAGRVVMGCGAGIFPLSYGIIRDEFPVARITSAIGVMAASVGVGIAIGFPFGGLLIDHLGVPAIFLTTATMAGLDALAVLALVPDSPQRRPSRIDLVGVFLLCSGLVTLLAAISRAASWGWLAPQTLGLASIGLVVVAVFAAHELRYQPPLVNVRMLVPRRVLTSNGAACLLGLGTIGPFVLIPLLAQVPRSTGYGLGVTALESGLPLVPSALATVVAAAMAGRFAYRFGPRNLMISGAVLVGASLGLMAAWHQSLLVLAIWGVAFGLGSGLSYTAMPTLIVEAVPQHMSGEATGVNTLLRSFGSGLGAQVVTSILATYVVAGTGLVGEFGFTLGLGACSAAGLAGAGVACLIPQVRRDNPSL